MNPNEIIKNFQERMAELEADWEAHHLDLSDTEWYDLRKNFEQANLVKFVTENGRRMPARYPGTSSLVGNDLRPINVGDEIYYAEGPMPRYDEETGLPLKKSLWMYKKVAILAAQVDEWLAAERVSTSEVDAELRRQHLEKFN
jgi:hypothetical protein